MKDVIPNLRPPAGLHHVATNLLDLLHALLLGNGNQLRFETLHGQILVHGLASLLRALDVQTAGQVFDADGRVDLVDVLSAGAPAAHGGDFQVLVGNFDLIQISLVQENGGHIHSRKGRLALVVGVKGRESNKSVGPLFALEPAIGMLPVSPARGDYHFYALESHHFSLLLVFDLYRVSHFVGVSFVHAFQICHPVVGFGSSGSRGQQNPTGLVVVGATQQELQLVFFGIFLQTYGGCF
mmetsp:Transcript_20217/g.50289  ORF Transcript_20217/g.50289 Transcript_20217/m.50289 type:complete len:239 (+) Transcript_20217:224-940(+)